VRHQLPNPAAVAANYKSKRENMLVRPPLQLVSDLRDALKHAEAELQRRCVISGEIRQAISAADDYIARVKNSKTLTLPESE
jgi:hypothetical protein